MTDQAKHQIRLARVEALLDYYPLNSAAELGEDGERLAETRFVLVQSSANDEDHWHAGADGVQELLNYQEQDEGWYAIGIWDLDEGLVASVETTCYVGDFGDHIGPSIYDVKSEAEEADPAAEAVANIKMVLQRLSQEAAPDNEKHQDDLADLEQAVRFLTGEEVPS
jgi:hypothetical protein